MCPSGFLQIFKILESFEKFKCFLSRPGKFGESVISGQGLGKVFGNFMIMMNR